MDLKVYTVFSRMVQSFLKASAVPQPFPKRVFGLFLVSISKKFLEDE